MVKKIFLEDGDSYEPIFLIISIILFVIVLYFVFNGSINISNDRFSCGDGTRDGFCSDIKPYYCSNEVLVERASYCGCSENTTIEGDSCISKYQKNPFNITLKYYLNGEQKNLNVTLYKGLVDYLSKVPREITYKEGETPPTISDFELKKINEEYQKQLLLPIVIQIENLDKDKTNQMRIAVSIVQNLDWGFSNKTLIFGSNKIPYSRYPYEVLYDSQGVCGEKSELLAFLLKELGFDVSLFYNQFENHESVGIKCPDKYSWHNSGYCFVETTGPSIITDSSIVYVGGVKITSKPELIPVSNGTSLGDNLYEYLDAIDMMNIRKKIEDTGKINSLDKSRLDELTAKYGLVKEYNTA